MVDNATRCQRVGKFERLGYGYSSKGQRDGDYFCVTELRWPFSRRGEIRGHSNMQAGIVLGLLTTVLVLDPQKLVCRALFGSYPHG